MPELTWVGKDKVINHHLDVPYRVLEHQYTYGLDAEREREREKLSIRKSDYPRG